MQVENTTETGALLGDDALDIEELPRVGVYVTTVAEGNIPHRICSCARSILTVLGKSRR